ncbi:MAG: hypothetical protein ACRDIY_07355 [Chloroflexota bacterium]
MEHRPEIYRLLREDAQTATAEPVDLWPAIRARLPQTSEALRRSGIAPRHRQPLHAALFALGILLVLGLLIGTTYRAQAKVSAFVSHLGIGVTLVPWTVDSLPSPNASQPVTHATAIPVRYLPLSEIQPQISFPIRRPSWVPTSYTLAGAMVVNSGHVRVQYYDGFDQRGLPKGAIGLVEILGITTTPYTFPASRTEEISVNGQTATYIRGSWKGNGNHGGLRWSDAADLHTISWQADGMTFMLQADETGLSRADVLRIANSVR